MSSSPPSSPILSPTTADLWGQLKSISLAREAKRLGQGRIPCARESLLLGMGTGAAMGVVGIVAKRGVKSSLNWGVGAFIMVSFVKFKSCQYTKQAEAARMRVVIEDFRRKKSGKSTSDNVAAASKIGEHQSETTTLR